MTAGFALCASTAVAGGSEDARSQARPEVSKFALPAGMDPNSIIFFESGPGGEGGEAGGTRDHTEVCTLPATSCYNRPNTSGTRPYPTLINGQFNMQEFAMADDFIPSADGDVVGLCWRGSYGGSTACDFLATPPARYTVIYYNDNGFGIPDIVGAPIATYQNDSLYGPGNGLVLTQTVGGTNHPVGFGGPREIGVAGTHPPVAVTADTPYWVEIFYLAEAGIPCFWLMGMSYESYDDDGSNGTPTLHEGNRRSQRVDRNAGNDYDFPFYVNLDMAICVDIEDGSRATVPLANSNSLDSNGNSLIPQPRTVPGNNEAAGALLFTCGQTGTDFDMTYSTVNLGLAGGAPFPCRKPTVDPVDYSVEPEGGDVWFAFDSTATSAQVGICATNVLGGSPMGDSLIELWQVTGDTLRPAAPVAPTLANLTRIGGSCNDDACGTQSDICVSGLTINRRYYARVGAFQPASKGILRFAVNCPCPTPDNDLCGGAIEIPGNSAGVGYLTPLGILLTGQTRTATIDGQILSCPTTNNTSRSVWYKIVGSGGTGVRVLLSLDQAPPGTTYNNAITVFCSANDDCNNLTCLAQNNNKQSFSGGEIDGQVEICVLPGNTYFVQVLGTPGGAQGDFALLAVALRDGSLNLIECCETQVCSPECSFQIPECNVLNEATDFTLAHQAGGGFTYEANEPCAVGNTNATRRNNGCNFSNTEMGLPARRWGYMPMDTTILGTTWSDSGFVDPEWFILRMPNYAYVDPLPPMGPQPQNNVTNRAIMDWAFQVEGPGYALWRSLQSNFTTCSYTGTFLGNFGTNVASTCGVGSFRRGINEHMPNVPDLSPASGVRTDGVAVVASGAGGFGEMSMHVQWFGAVALPAGSGYDCTKSQRYWVRCNWLHPVGRCDGLPARAPGTFDDEKTLPTFDGTGGADGVLVGEQCFPSPNAPGILTGTTTDFEIGGKDGCFAVPATDGDVFEIRANIPFRGQMECAANSTSGASRDLDYMKLVLDEPAQVTLSYESGFAGTVFLTSNSCDVDSITYLVAGTNGSCGARQIDIRDQGILGIGTYILLTSAGDGSFPNGAGAFTPYDCSDVITHYEVIVQVDPLPGCSPTCPGGAVVENEPCGTETVTCDFDSTNNGCAQNNFYATPFSGTAALTNLCGNLYSNYQVFPDPTYPFQGDTFFGDIDYYEFTVPGGQRRRVTVSAESNAAVLVQIIETGANGALCPVDLADAPLRLLGQLDADLCAAARGVASSTTVYLDPGTYSVVVMPGSIDNGGRSFADYDCDLSQTIGYTVRVETDQMGSCCTGTDCAYTASDECPPANFSLNGTCGDGYNQVGGAGAFATISGSVAAVSPNLEDEEVRQFAIPPFDVRGATYTQVGISSNGFLVFGSTINSNTARAFPNTALPNAVVAPLWYDWDPSAPDSEIYIQTTGGLGNEVTVVEWFDMAAWSDWDRRASFQAVLFHASGAIEFRYGTFEDLCEIDRRAFGVDSGQTISAGIEGAAATAGDGINYPITTAFLTTTHSSVRFEVNQDGNPCAVPPCCPGNADKIGPGQVTFNDVLAVLANFLNPGANPNGTSVGDANCNGVIDFNDVLNVLANFLALCP